MKLFTLLILIVGGLFLNANITSIYSNPVYCIVGLKIIKNYFYIIDVSTGRAGCDYARPVDQNIISVPLLTNNNL